jgi:hypothetical protein
VRLSNDRGPPVDNLVGPVDNSVEKSRGQEDRRGGGQLADELVLEAVEAPLEDDPPEDDPPEDDPPEDDELLDDDESADFESLLADDPLVALPDEPDESEEADDPEGAEDDELLAERLSLR